MTEVVYMLGAGFNLSMLDPSAMVNAPLARNFFQAFMKSRYAKRLDVIRANLPLDVLLKEIERYWKLDLEALASTPFDIEECMTLFESQLADELMADRVPRLPGICSGHCNTSAVASSSSRTRIRSRIAGKLV